MNPLKSYSVFIFIMTSLLLMNTCVNGARQWTIFKLGPLPSQTLIPLVTSIDSNPSGSKSETRPIIETIPDELKSKAATATNTAATPTKTAPVASTPKVTCGECKTNSSVKPGHWTKMETATPTKTVNAQPLSSFRGPFARSPSALAHTNNRVLQAAPAASTFKAKTNTSEKAIKPIEWDCADGVCKIKIVSVDEAKRIQDLNLDVYYA